MKSQEILSLVKFEENPESCTAQEIIEISNIEFPNWKSKFYPNIR